MDKIDFVVLWVDETDPVWLEEKKYHKPDLDIADAVTRYRDWGTLKYWFRGVEKFAPWVNNIYFITYGHLPEFLNTNHPKIKVINHKDIIDEKYLPTYNSNVIDLNMFRIKDLSEHFVYFNDDVFLTQRTKPEDFFQKGLPVDEYKESPIGPIPDNYSQALFNNIALLSKHFDKQTSKKKLKGKYYNIRYGLDNINNWFFAKYRYLTGFYNPHVTQAFLKSYFERVYELEKEAFETTYANKFRDKTDITLYLVRYFQLLDGKFVPRKAKFGHYFGISKDNTELLKAIRRQKYKVLCLNDVSADFDFEKAKKEIQTAFEVILPEKSEFEK